MTVVGSVIDTFRPRQIVDRGSFTGGYPFDVDLGQEVLLQTLLGSQASVAPNFLGFVQAAYRNSPVLFGLIANRMHLFGEIRWAWREYLNGRPGDIFSTAELDIVNRPWPGGNAASLLNIAEVHNACAGNFFAHRKEGQLRVMRPDWTGIVIGTDQDSADLNELTLDADVLGYLYQDGGPAAGDLVFLPPEEVAHYMPQPDPEFGRFRGMAWLTPIVQELCADSEMTAHKRKYLQGGATPNLAMVLDPEKLNIKSPADFEQWVKKFEELRAMRSGGNPYKMMFLIGGADPVPIGANLDSIDFAKVQSSGEVRMAVAAMVHPAVAAIEAGLQGSALNAGNFDAAFRQFANGTMRPLWSKMAAALERVVVRPRENVVLWPDDRDVPALAEDSKKLAEIMAADAQTASTLFQGGWDPDAIIDAINSRDITRLKGNHIGLPSVQLQKGASPNGNSPQREREPATQ